MLKKNLEDNVTTLQKKENVILKRRIFFPNQNEVVFRSFD
jgi:hypothetical protein